MENRTTKTITRQPNTYRTVNNETDNQLVQKRLDSLLAANAETAREKSLYSSEKELFEAELMKNPINSEKAFSYFGLLLGSFPPVAMFTKFFLDAGNYNGEDFWILGVVAIVTLISSVVGYFSGKLIGRIVRELENHSWGVMLLTLPFVGILWGIMAGGAGGVVIFIFGAILGAILGAMVGAAALPVFGIFHRMLKKGDMVELNQFFPLAFGITFVICALILGF